MICILSRSGRQNHALSLIRCIHCKDWICACQVRETGVCLACPSHLDVAEGAGATEVRKYLPSRPYVKTGKNWIRNKGVRGVKED